jgi:uncharacterized protein YbjT (DUF2867 family)
MEGTAMSDQLVLVTGATGNTGSGVVTGLLAKGVKVRALVRNATKAEGLKSQGAELAVGDLDDPASLTADVFDGVTDVYFCTWNGPNALDQWKNFQAALESAGASPRIVRLAAFGAPESRIIQQLAEAEHELKQSGLVWTILQPTLQNTMMTAQSVKEQGAIYFDWGDGKAGMIDVRDIVDSAVGVLTTRNGQFDGQSFILTGPQAIGFADVAAGIGKAVGKDVNYVPVPHDAAKQAMMDMGVPEWIVDGYVELSIGFENNFANTTTDGVEKLAGHPPRSFEQFAADFEGVWRG